MECESRRQEQEAGGSGQAENDNQDSRRGADKSQLRLNKRKGSGH